MMPYFYLEKCSNEKIMGKIPQIKEYIHDYNIKNDSRSIYNFTNKKIDFEPVLSTVALYAQAKETDFIKTFGITGFGFGNIISEKLKKIIDSYTSYGIQYFKTFIYHKNVKKYGYWKTHHYDYATHMIDYAETTFLFKDESDIKNIVYKEVKFENENDFLLYKKEIEYPKRIFFKSIKFKKEMNFDFFILGNTDGGRNGIVSERLKIEIEKQGCIGMEFRPIHVTLNEWYSGGEREKIYGRSY